MLAPADEIALFDSWRAGDSRAGDRIVAEYMPMVRARALRYVGVLDADDAVQEATLAFLEAMRSCDPARSRMSTWAELYIKNRLNRLVMRRGQVSVSYGDAEKRMLKAMRGAELGETAVIAGRAGVSVERAEAFVAAVAPARATSLDETLEELGDADAEDVIGRIECRERQERLASAIGSLSERQAAVIRMRLSGASYAEASKRLGVSHERARQLEARAVENLRRLLAERG